MSCARSGECRLCETDPLAPREAVRRAPRCPQRVGQARRIALRCRARRREPARGSPPMRSWDGVPIASRSTLEQAPPKARGVLRQPVGVARAAGSARTRRDSADLFGSGHHRQLRGWCEVGWRPAPRPSDAECRRERERHQFGDRPGGQRGGDLLELIERGCGFGDANPAARRSSAAASSWKEMPGRR